MPIRRLIAPALALAALFATAPSGAAIFPPGARLKAAQDFGATGDGTTDDTAALIRAIGATISDGGRTLRLPTGTYLVSDRLAWLDAAGKWQSKLTLQGDGRDKTTIRLADNCPGFGDPAKPRAVIHTASNNPQDPANGAGVNGFRNFVKDLTVDTGVGNPGAIGIDWLGTNHAGIYRVAVKTSDPDLRGVAGIAMTRYASGPCVIRDVTVDGFDVGIEVRNPEYSQVYRNLTLTNQRVAGVRNSNNVLTFWGLDSAQGPNVPAVQTTNGLVTITDGDLGGDSPNPAIVATGPFLGYYLDGVEATGYGSLLTGRPGLMATRTAPWAGGEKVRDGVPATLFGPAPKTLGLPARDTPADYEDPNLTRWVNALDFGAVPTTNGTRYDPAKTDSTAAIQAAIDDAAAKGKTTVYLPFGYYHVSDTITIRGGVRRLAFFESEVWPKGRAFSDPANPRPLFRFQGTADCQIDGLDTGSFQEPHPGLIWIEHDSPKRLILKHCQCEVAKSAGAYRNTANGTGELYVENCSTGGGVAGWDFAYPQQVFAVQLNDESRGTHLRVRSGARVRIVGLKTEAGFTQGVVDQGGALEVLGGLLYPLTNGPANPVDVPAFDVAGRMTGVFAVSAYGSLANGFGCLVRETRGRETRRLGRDAVIPRGFGSTTLYLGN